MRLALLLALPAALLPGAAASQDPGLPGDRAASRDRADAIEAFSRRLADAVASDDAGGIAAGVVVDGDLVWAGAYGWSDREAREPMRPSAVSRTGSISKSITAMLMLRLVDRGVVGLDDPVERYLPEFGTISNRDPRADSVTLRQLASHTAGIVREPANLREMASGPIEAWERRVVESLRQTAYDTVPGARYQYSNIGFGALGLALSRAAGRPFMDLVEDEIFTPLGMTGSTFVAVGGALEDRLARGYVNRENGSLDAEGPEREHAGRGYKVPNGGIYSTVADLGRFLGAIAGVPGLDILTADRRREMVSIQTPEPGNRGYGLGLSVEIREDGQRIVGHGGSVAGYTAFVATNPDTRIGVVLLRNYQRGGVDLGTAARDLVAELSAVSADTFEGDPDAEWVEVDGGPDTRCAFDTPFRFFHHAAAMTREPSSTGLEPPLLIYFQGGGACWDFVSCSGMFDPTTERDELHGYSGVFDFSHPDNPFRDFSVLFVPYCTGDVHVGDAEVRYGGPDARPVAHNGAKNVRSALRWVVERSGAPDRVVVAGASAGAYAAVFYAPQIARQFPGSTVFTLADSGVPLLDGYPRILERWGAGTGLRDLWQAEEVVPLSLERGYAAAAEPSNMRAVVAVTSDRDAVQSAFYLISGSPYWRERTYELLDRVEALHGAGSFIVPGDDHGLLRTDAFFTYEAAGVTLRDWIADLVQGRNVATVRCEGCCTAEDCGAAERDE